jgi:hypothetical protein
MTRHRRQAGAAVRGTVWVSYCSFFPANESADKHVLGP